MRLTGPRLVWVSLWWHPAYFWFPCLLIYNFFGNEAEERIANEKAKLVKLENGDEESDEEKAHCRLQLAITVFLVTWSPYVIESFFTYSAQIPNIVGVVCAFIPIITTTLIPLWYIKWKKEADRLYSAVSHVQHCWLLTNLLAWKKISEKLTERSFQSEGMAFI